MLPPRSDLGSPNARSSTRHHLHERVQALAASGQFAEALSLLEEPLRQHPRDAEILRLAAEVLYRAGNAVQAAHLAERAEAIESHPATMLIVADHRMRAGDTDGSLAICERLLAAHPGHIHTRLVMARALESAVRTAAARAVLEPLLADVQGKQPEAECEAQQLMAAVLVHEKREGEAVELLDHAVLVGRAPDSVRRTALYLRAKACDRLKRYDEAWESAAAANAIGDPQFDPAGYAEGVGALMAHWTRAEMEKFPSSRSASEVPVFIAGMPRSGTSLLDQV
ncbi:MAG: tetratricopeptide repeat protein, partial [Bacteroidia bacterium]|nr:tetratricopeptide repeat protein [Bacteroidia bacterium]